MIMGHVGDTASLPGQKTHITKSRWCYGFFSTGKLHSEHSAVFPLTVMLYSVIRVTSHQPPSCNIETVS